MTGRRAGGTLLAMRKEKNASEKAEAPVEAETAPVETSAPVVEAPVVVEPAPAKPAKKRNLSVEGLIRHYKYQCAYEKSKHSEYDTQPGGILKRDGNGDVVIQDGVPVLDNRRITKHAAIDLEYGAKIAKLEKTGKL